MAVVTTNLGVITAYGDAVAAGYTGTKAEWQALMANYATVGQQAAQDAQTASQAAQTATTKAGEASQSATRAENAAASITTPDTTLTQAGVAADAKATGDEIADLKEDLTQKVSIEQGTAHAGEALIIGADGKVTTGEAGVSVDPTLSIEGKAADAKAVGDALSELITKEEHNDGNVVNMENAIINANKNLQNVPPVILNDGLYYSNPFVTTNTVILTFKPVDSEGNAIGMTKNGQAVSVIGEDWGQLNIFAVTGLEVVKRSYHSFHNYEINWKGGSPETYILESAPDHWVVNGYARAADSNLNVGLTNGAYHEEYIPYSDPYYTWEPTGLLEKYPYITVDSESKFADETKLYKYNGYLYFYDGEKWAEIANADSLDDLDALKSDLSKNKEAVSQLVAEISKTDGNVVDTSGASITSGKNISGVPSVILDNGVYYTNPFVTTKTVILVFTPKDSDGNSIQMTKPDGTVVRNIGESWATFSVITVSDLVVEVRNYSSYHNYEINWTSGTPLELVLAARPDHWDVTGYARATDSDLNVGLTKGSYNTEYIAYSAPTYEWEPVDLLQKYPYISAKSEAEFVDSKKLYRYNGYLNFNDGEKWVKLANVVKSNFLTIAHKGYGDPNIANTVQSFVNAANVGFRAVEVDCRQTSDGVYVASHNDVTNLYSGGVRQSYTISQTAWSELKGNTVDANGLYPLATVAQIFNTLRHYDMEYFVIDLKTGSNAAIMDLARRCGVADQLMLSYYSMESLIADIDVLKRYPEVAIRITPSGTQQQFDQIRDAIPNMLYADINISESYSVLIPNALSWHIPILCSGVQESTIKYMAPIAAGAMSQTSLQYSPTDFHNMIAMDYNQFPELSSDKQSISLSVSGTTTVSITTTIDDVPCYAFAYSSDMSVFKAQISSIGVTSSFVITAMNQGTADLVVFTATGEQLTIPVTVS